MKHIATSLTLLLGLAVGTAPAFAASAISLSPLPGAHPQTVAATSTCRSGDTDAAISRAFMPVLPTIADEQGASGTTLVEIRLSTSGSLQSSKVFATSGNPHIDNAALEAARASSYAPAVHECAGQAGSYLVRVEFTK